MVDNMMYQNPIFETTDGTKYAINPFAGIDNQTSKDLTKATNADHNIVTHAIICAHCKLTFPNKAQIEIHKIQDHGKGVHRCNVCKATFRRRDHLKRHTTSIHSNQRYYLCPICEIDCKRHDMLLKHVNKKHSTQTEVFRCRQCDFRCTTLTALEQHEVCHQLTDRHVCPQCYVSFKRKDHMLRHIKSQHLNHCVVCPICGRKYKRKDHVARHMREKHKIGMLNGKIVESSDV